MLRYFNIAGPCNFVEHYMIDSLKRGGHEMLDLIEQKQYFVLHAARQSGKTTLLWDLADKINTESKYHTLYCSLEGIQGITDPKDGIPAIVFSIKNDIKKQRLPQDFSENADFNDYANVLNVSLCEYCKVIDKPLVIFFDEADCLSNGTLISFLRQLRSGYASRARVPFVHSIALVGMRNIRDYKAKIRPESETLGSASPFNIISEALTLSTFTFDEISELYSQYTNETNQIIEKETIQYIYEQTDGQPWLVNAIMRECVTNICKNKNTPITQEMARKAIDTLILKRPTHFDSLMERLKEPRVRSIIEPLILGEGISIDFRSDDYLYTRDLGLIKEFGKGVIKPANPIYAEIIIRALNYSLQENIKLERPTDDLPKYIVNNKIDMNILLKEFQIFWRENSEIWITRYNDTFYQYIEAAPHLVLQAFLQRVINGGAKLTREMALGKKRIDLCIEYLDNKYPIEIKILRNEKTIKDGLEQTYEYMEKCGSSHGWLVIFDRDSDKSWDEKLYIRSEIYKEKTITVVGA